MAHFINVIKNFKNLRILEQILFILFILISICIISNFFYKKVENFETNSTKFILKQDNEIYDDFYITVYDILNYNKIKNQFEIGSIIDTTTPNEESIILEIGSKMGHHVNQLNNITPHVIGIDESIQMINHAKNIYPQSKFLNENILNHSLFNNNYFTHIICLNHMIYHIKNKKQFFNNCFYWLKKGGFLILNLIDKSSLNSVETIINIKNNILPFSDYPELCLSDSMNFKDFKYNSQYKNINPTLTIYEEIFKYKNGNVRKNEQKLFIEDIKDILKITKYLGFIVIKIIDVKCCKYTKNYLYILQKI